MLTRKQHQLLTYIRHCLDQSGVPPSFDEMKEEMGLKSKSGIHRLILGLEERGFIHRLPNRARALEVIKLPDDAMGYVPPSRPELPKKSDTKHHAKTSNQQVTTVPLLGRIDSGTPVEKLREERAQIEVPAHFVSIGEHFALEIEGDSMIEAGIFENDTVIIRRCNMAETGAIVVALIDRQKVTIKRLRQRGDSMALEPANKTYETRIFGMDRVHIQGKLVGLIRHYE